MNDKKIAIIFHTTNEFYVEDALESFRRLKVPENFSVEVLPVQDEEKFHAYNRAMNHSDAKYKIYLDENISTLHKNILLKVIKLFQSDKKIGLFPCPDFRLVRRGHVEDTKRGTLLRVLLLHRVVLLNFLTIRSQRLPCRKRCLVCLVVSA